MNKTLKKRLIIFLIVIICLIILDGIFFLVDNNRAKKGETPLFCFVNNEYSDGGTVEYIGFGYKVIFFHKIEENGFYDGIYVCSLFKSTDEVYKEERETVSTFISRLGDGEIYNILSKYYDEEKLNEIVIRILDEEEIINSKYYGEVESVKTEEGGTIISTGSTNELENTKKKEFSEAREEWIGLCVDLLNIENVDEILEESEINSLRQEIRSYYNQYSEQFKSDEIKEKIENTLGINK